MSLMGRVLALDVSHNGPPIRDCVNFGKLALIGRSACKREWLLALPLYQSTERTGWSWRAAHQGGNLRRSSSAGGPDKPSIAD